MLVWHHSFCPSYHPKNGSFTTVKVHIKHNSTDSCISYTLSIHFLCFWKTLQQARFSRLVSGQSKQCSSMFCSKQRGEPGQKLGCHSPLVLCWVLEPCCSTTVLVLPSHSPLVLALLQRATAHRAHYKPGCVSYRNTLEYFEKEA